MTLTKSGSATLSKFVLISIALLLCGCDKKEDPEIQGNLVTITDYDGNTYHTKEIGKQWWMINNLKTT